MIQPDQYHVVVEGQLWLEEFDPEALRSAKTMTIEPTDTFVVTYPKSGTTWIQHIGLQFLRGDSYNTEKGFIGMYCPFIEFSAKNTEQASRPRYMKTHLIVGKSIPWSENAKYIYCVRNPKDVVVSFYHHYRSVKAHNFDGDFDEFFKMFVTGKVMYGSYFDHLLAYLPYTKKSNVLLLKYEDMLEDLESSIKKIANFLGGPASTVLNDPQRIESIVNNSRFSAMKEKENFMMPKACLNEGGEFVRKGIKRGWKKYLSKEQSDHMDTLFEQHLAGTEAENWWKKEMAWDD